MIWPQIRSLKILSRVNLRYLLEMVSTHLFGSRSRNGNEKNNDKISFHYVVSNGKENIFSPIQRRFNVMNVVWTSKQRCVRTGIVGSHATQAASSLDRIIIIFLFLYFNKQTIRNISYFNRSHKLHKLHKLISLF